MSRFRSGTSTTFLIRLLDSETKEQARSPPLRSSKIFKHWQIWHMDFNFKTFVPLHASTSLQCILAHEDSLQCVYIYICIPMRESGGRKNAMVMVIICNYLITSSHSSCQSVSQFWMTMIQNWHCSRNSFR